MGYTLCVIGKQTRYFPFVLDLDTALVPFESLLDSVGFESLLSDAAAARKEEDVNRDDQGESRDSHLIDY